MSYDCNLIPLSTTTFFFQDKIIENWKTKCAYFLLLSSFYRVSQVQPISVRAPSQLPKNKTSNQMQLQLFKCVHKVVKCGIDPIFCLIPLFYPKDCLPIDFKKMLKLSAFYLVHFKLHRCPWCLEFTNLKSCIFVTSEARYVQKSKPIV